MCQLQSYHEEKGRVRYKGTRVERERKKERKRKEESERKKLVCMCAYLSIAVLFTLVVTDGLGLEQSTEKEGHCKEL
jgi:hypothetical protein